MAEDPRYLQNESRHAHRIYRFNRTIGRWAAALMFCIGVGHTGSAVLDLIGNFGWGFHTRDVWHGLIFLIGAPLFLAFFTLVNRLVLVFGRRLFGPDPDSR